MKYHVALMQLITGTPFAEPWGTFNDLSLTEQFGLHREFAKNADAYRATTSNPDAPVFLIAPEYLFCAHSRDGLGDVTHRFFPNATKKEVLEATRKLSEDYPKVVFVFAVSWLKNIADGEGTTEGRNTTYVYYKGQKIFSQHKNGDAGELLPGDTTSGVRYRVFGDPVSSAKSRRQPVDGVFVVDGESFGIETCCDFGCRLPFSVGDSQTIPNDIKRLAGQFLISSTVDHTQGAKDSRDLGIDVFHSDYFFHVDGRKDLWEPPRYSPDYFSKHLMGAFKVGEEPGTKVKVLEPIAEQPTRDSMPGMSCYSVSSETQRSSHPVETGGGELNGGNACSDSPVGLSEKPSRKSKSLLSNLFNWSWF